MLTPSQKAEFMELLRRYQQQRASPGEIKFLDNYYQYFDVEDKRSLNLTPEERTLLERRVYQNIERLILTSGQSAPVVGIRFFPLRKLAVAAVVFILFAGSILLYFRHSRETQPPLARVQTRSERYKNDLEPGSNKAVLTLADGSRIVLDSARNGSIGTQGNSKILKFKNGELAYQPQDTAIAEGGGQGIKYNIVSTPKGGQYQIELSDGSKIWLNAASSIRFPTAFRGNERQVELTGEAYFEVAAQYQLSAEGKRMEKVPFFVNVRGMQVQVLGTHFNINAYDDEASVKTTLLEGAVKVVKGSGFTLLKPGNQSEVDRDGNMKFIAESKVEDAVAWKNGVFEFRSAGIETIMRQIARWYDVDVEYQKKVTEQFYAEIPRNTRASELFKILEATGAVHFEIEGRKVKVLP